MHIENVWNTDAYYNDLDPYSDIQPGGADDPMQFCLTSITAEVIMAAHAACGHGRLFKTTELIKTQFFWPSLQGV